MHVEGLLPANMCLVERSGSWVEHRTLDQKDPGSPSFAAVSNMEHVFHSTLLQFIQLYE